MLNFSKESALIQKFLKLFLIFLLFANSTVLHASVYDEDVLEIFAKILPRFVLMREQKKDLQNNINICILHDQVDTQNALSLIDKISKNYPEGLKTYSLQLYHTDFSSINRCENSQLIFLFNSNKNNIQKTLEYAKTRQALTVSYDDKLLQQGVEISLFLGRKIIPYINIQTLKQNGIKLNNLLLRISKIYIEADQ